MLGDRFGRMLFLVFSGLSLGGLINAFWYNDPVRDAALYVLTLAVSLIFLWSFHDAAESPDAP